MTINKRERKRRLSLLRNQLRLSFKDCSRTDLAMRRVQFNCSQFYVGMCFEEDGFISKLVRGKDSSITKVRIFEGDDEYSTIEVNLLGDYFDVSGWRLISEKRFDTAMKRILARSVGE